MERKPLVIIESPYAGDVDSNLRYARVCMKDSLKRGEYPFASHLLYTQTGILDDTNPLEREQGIQAGLEWGKHCDYVAVYCDFGISAGMLTGIRNARANGKRIHYRRILKTFKEVINDFR